MANWLESLGLYWRPPDRRSRREIDDEIRAELDFHVGMCAADLERGGLGSEEARREALRRFGDPARIEKACRQAQIGERIMLQRIQAGLLVALVAVVGWLAWQNHRSERASSAALAAMANQLGQLERRLGGGERSGLSDLAAPPIDDPRAERRAEAASADGANPGDGPAAEERSAPTPAQQIETLLSRLNGDPDWRKAFEIGDEIARLPPDEGLALLRSIWPRIADPQHRRQMLKCFAMRELHPRALPILDLAMRDGDLGVQNFAITYLRPIALQDFASDYAGYDAWFAQKGSRPLDEVITASANDLVARLRSGESTAALAALSYLSIAPAASVGVDLSRLLRDAGLVDWIEARVRVEDGEVDPLLAEALATTQPDFETLASWMTQGGGRRATAREALQRIQEPVHEDAVKWLLDSSDKGLRQIGFECLPRAELSDNFVRSRVAPLVADPEHADPEELAWACAALGDLRPEAAVEPLLEGLRRVPTARASSRRDYVDALARLGDARAIPELIGLLEAEKDGTTLEMTSGALSTITGVRGAHDGAFWRRWWEENQRRLPAGVNAALRGDRS